jgi:hypothetical protein
MKAGAQTTQPDRENAPGRNDETREGNENRYPCNDDTQFDDKKIKPSQKKKQEKAIDPQKTEDFASTR